MSESPIPAFSGKLVHNVDIHIPHEVVALFPKISRLLRNDELEREIALPERNAARYKLLFNLFGITSLVLIIVTLLLTTIRLGVVSIKLVFPDWLVVIAAVLGLISLALSLVSYFFDFKAKWLFNRFVAERIRQWKFQQLLDGALIDHSLSNSDSFAVEVAKRWSSFKFDFVYKIGAMDSFVKAEDFSLFIIPQTCRPDVTDEVFAAYYKLRLKYQADYCIYKQRELIETDELTKALAKFSLLIGGVLAVAEVVMITLRDPTLESTLGWILGISGLCAALISAAMRVFRNAKAVSEETERYTSKWVVFKLLTERFQNNNASPDDRLQVMIETERVCVEELREFIRAFQKADYLF